MAQCGFAARAMNIKKCTSRCSSVASSRLGNLIKQVNNVKGRPNASLAQLAECLHGKQEDLGSSPGRAMVFPPL